MALSGGQLQRRLAITYLFLALVILGVAGAYVAWERKKDVVNDLKAGLYIQTRLASRLITSELFRPENLGPLHILTYGLGEETGVALP